MGLMRVTPLSPGLSRALGPGNPRIVFAAP